MRSEVNMDHNASHMPQSYYLDPERKLAEIQRQKEHVERQLLARSKQLEHFHSSQERERRQTVDRVMGGLHHERKLLLDEEVKRRYGMECGALAVPGMLEMLLSERRKEFMQNQQDIMLQMKNLNEERLRLCQARERVKENRSFSNSYSPLPSPVYSVNGAEDGFRDDEETASSPREMETFISERKRKLPLEAHAFLSRRSIFNKEYNWKLRPYRGELGLESYAPWQMEDYIVVRKLLDEFLDDFLDMYLPPDYHLLEKEVAQARLAADMEEKHLLHPVSADDRAINLIAEEIVLEVTGSMVDSVVCHIYHLTGVLRNLTDQTIMSTAEHVVTGNERGRTPGEPEYRDVTKTYLMHQRERTLPRANVWSHTQSLSISTADVEDSELPEGEDPYANDGTPLIDFDSASVSDVSLPLVFRRRDDLKGTQLAQNHYISRELNYWRDMEPSLFSITLSKKCRGVTSVQPSNDHRYLALGTGHGDLLIYGLWTSPWLVVRVAINQGKADDPVHDIRWSLDHTRLVTVNKLGGVHLWSMKPWGAPVDRTTVRGLGLILTNNSYLPFQLLPLLSLHTEDGDFRFRAGPLSERQAISDGYFPIHATFFPDVTLLGVQHSVCVAMSNGDILKLSTEHVTTTTTSQHSGQDTEQTTDQSAELKSTRFLHKPLTSDNPNLMGGGVIAELFRKHISPLMLIGYLQNCGKMISVDEEGSICVWSYSKEDIQGSDWVKPSERYRINPYKTMYSPGKDSLRNVIFSERDMKSKQISTERIEVKRREVSTSIKSGDLGRPWHIQELPAQRLTVCTYLPKRLIPPTGALFHTVMRHQPGGLLSTYFTRLYKPVRVKSSRLLGCCLNPSSTELIVLLLYPEVLPKGHHVSVIVVDLQTMKVKDLRVDIPISEDQYSDALKDNNVSFGVFTAGVVGITEMPTGVLILAGDCRLPYVFAQELKELLGNDVTRVMGPPGTDYLLVSIGGEIMGVSLLTGQIVLQMEDPNANTTDFGGCSIDALAWNNPPNSKMSVVSCAGGLYVVSYAPKSSMINVMALQSTGSSESRRQMAVAFKRWGNQSLCPPSERMNGGKFYIAEDVHPEVFAYSLCLDLIDRVVAGKGEQPVERNNIAAAYLVIQEKRKNRPKDDERTK